LPIAAIVHADHAGTDRLLTKFVDGLRHAGLRIHGLVQERAENGDKTSTMLVDQHSGQRYPCSRTSARARHRVASMQAALPRRASPCAAPSRRDLTFAWPTALGGPEAQGGGLAAEMLNGAAAGIPLLTISLERLSSGLARLHGRFGHGAGSRRSRPCTCGSRVPRAPRTFMKQAIGPSLRHHH
jgi:hypothetical protein